MNRTLGVALAAAACLVVTTACKQSLPANVAAAVNGRPIPYADLEKQYRLQFAEGSPDRPSDDQTSTQKLQILRIMIDNEIMLQRAEKLSLMASDSDVDAKFNELKAPYTQEDFARQLATRKMTADDLKQQLRRELSMQKLFNKEFTSHINISDKDVENFYNTNKPSFNLAEPQVHLMQVLVTPSPSAEVKNLKNDKAQNDDQARTKIQMIEARLRRNEDFAMVAQSYSEDPSTAANGGDLGFIPESALGQANPELRKMVMSMQPGELSKIIHTPEGYRILKLVSKEPAGQRELNDPRVQQSIRETLFNRKDQLLREAYYEMARNEAKVINQFANTIIQERDKK
jgi:peptidyl-prolyl cis-trans isomerase SurA